MGGEGMRRGNNICFEGILCDCHEFRLTSGS